MGVLEGANEKKSCRRIEAQAFYLQ